MKTAAFALSIRIRIGVDMLAAVENAVEWRSLYDRLVDGDEHACREVVRDLMVEQGGSVSSMCRAITAAFHKIGEAWECAHISIYREHVASQIGYRLLQELRARIAAPRCDAPTAIGCTPEKDPYALPTCMVELVLGELGWNAHSLGTNLPLSELKPAIQRYRPRLCWVSVSYTESPGELSEQLVQLGQAGQEHGTQVICGGRAVPADIRSGTSIRFIPSLAELERFVTNDLSS